MQPVPASAVGVRGDAAVLSQRSSIFLDYWMDLRGSNPMPAAVDINPADFVSLLPYMRYMSWTPDGDVIYRVWGTTLVQWMKADFTGRSILDLLPPSERTLEHTRLTNLHLKPCGFVQQREVTDLQGIVHMFEFLTLPVGPGPDGANRMIGPGSICNNALPHHVEFEVNPRTIIKSFHYLDLGFGVPVDLV